MRNRIESPESGLAKYPGLQESLDTLTDYEKPEESAPYNYEQIVKILATDKSAREEAQEFLKGSPWDRDPEAAESVLKKLSWSLR